MREWGFKEDSEDVDIDRIHNELTSADLSYIEGRPDICATPCVIEVQVYLELLKKHAPNVYKRFHVKYKNIGCVKT